MNDNNTAKDGNMKKNYPELGLKRLFAGKAGGAWAMLALLGMLLLPSRAMADTKDATVAIPYYSVSLSEFEFLVEKDQSILPASLPVDIAKFTRTVTLNSPGVSVAFTYNDAAPTDRSQYQLKAGTSQPFPSGMLGSNPATFANIKSRISYDGQKFTYDSNSPIHIINTEVDGYKYNQFRIEFMHAIKPDEDLTDGDDLSDAWICTPTIQTETARP